LLLNAGVGTAQERKAEKVIDALNEYHPPLCKVLREGSTQEVDGSMLVPGDIVVLEAGDRVPADLRLLKVWNLEANETALTGESLPVPKQIQLLSSDCPLAERSNMLYMGTDITRGKGIGLVVGTGMNTEIGYLMSLMKGQENLATPLHDRVTGISKKFVKYAAIAGGIVFAVGFLRGNPLTQLAGTSITLAASAVPEGLPITITIALSAGIARMAKKNAVVRKMSAIETLGRTTVICTDKTGTLTKNEMTVKRIATLTKAWDVSGDGYEPKGELHLLYKNEVAATELSIGTEDPELQKIVRIGLLCNNSELLENEGNWSIKGDPTEGALLSLSGKLSHQPEEIKRWQRVHEVPFDSNSGTMTVVCRDHNQEQDQECFIFCKGSVESILTRSRWVQVNGEVRPLTAEAKAIILKQNLQLAEEALRVLGFAYCPTKWLDGQPPQLDDELIYVGLTGMMDPPKPEAEQSIREADALGIKTVMITGDHPATAIAIAQRLGFGERARQVLTGIELDQLSQEILIDRIEDIAIFARVTPEHKLRIVQAFQARGHVVAMTGDGVNDTPAIKQANVGIAMGRNGTEVAKATADMVLLQDGFDTILAGVKEGRTIIGNIRKAIGCLLTGNLAEILVTATAVIIGLPMPLVPIQILLMNLLTDAIPAMILAINPGAQDGDNAAAPPRQDVVDRQLYQKVITRGILLGAASLTLFAVTLGSGVPLPVAQTVAFTTLVMGQFAQTLSWRKEGSTPAQPAVKDRYLLLGMGGSLLALLGTLYIPSLSRFFHTAPLGASHWVAVLLIASLVSLVSKPFLYWMTSKSPLLSSASPNLLQTQPKFQVA
jgi:magnesium-transporting ATPase (P-type)